MCDIGSAVLCVFNEDLSKNISLALARACLVGQKIMVLCASFLRPVPLAVQARPWCVCKFRHLTCLLRVCTVMQPTSAHLDDCCNGCVWCVRFLIDWHWESADMLTFILGGMSDLRAMTKSHNWTIQSVCMRVCVCGCVCVPAVTLRGHVCCSAMPTWM